MICPNSGCGREIDSSSKFCPYCGTKIVAAGSINTEPAQATDATTILGASAVEGAAATNVLPADETVVAPVTAPAASPVADSGAGAAASSKLPRGVAIGVGAALVIALAGAGGYFGLKALQGGGSGAEAGSAQSGPTDSGSKSDKDDSGSKDSDSGSSDSGSSSDKKGSGSDDGSGKNDGSGNGSNGDASGQNGSGNNSGQNGSGNSGQNGNSDNSDNRNLAPWTADELADLSVGFVMSYWSNALPSGADGSGAIADSGWKTNVSAYLAEGTNLWNEMQNGTGAGYLDAEDHCVTTKVLSNVADGTDGARIVTIEVGVAGHRQNPVPGWENQVNYTYEVDVYIGADSYVTGFTSRYTDPSTGKTYSQSH